MHTRRWAWAAFLMAATIVVTADWKSAAAAPQNPSFGGRWTINRSLSQFPREVGFGVAIPPGLGSGGGEGGAPSLFVPRNVSEAEARNERQLVDEVRTPSPHLTIVQSAETISITDDFGHSRRFRLNGADDPQEFDAAPVPSNARWEGTYLVIRYKVARDREVRYTYSRKLDPAQMIVQVQFVERGSKDVITRVYEPARDDESATPPGPLPAGAAPQAPAGAPASRPPAASPARADVPAVAGIAQAPLGAIKPDAELKGITRLGVVVDGVDSAASACGLKQDAIETLVSKSLTDVGLKVARNADEDTYVYVNINTTKMTTGFCVSRYDAILYSYTTAKLSYSDSPLLVQVSLLRNGGLSGGAAGPHTEAVTQALKQYVDQFAVRIRNANK